MKKENKITIIVSIIALAVVLIGVTTAYLSARITGLESASIISLTSGRMQIVYTEGDENVVASHIYPKEEPWVTKTFTMTAYNTTNEPMIYNLGLNITTNTFPNYYLSYELTLLNSTGGNPIDSAEGFINGDGFYKFGTGSFRSANGEKHEYELKIFFKDNGNNQNDAQRAELNAKVSIIDGEAISYDFRITNAPSNGHAFDLGEDVEMEFSINNNGSTTLTVDDVESYLGGDSFGTFDVDSGETVSLNLKYTIMESDLDNNISEQMIVTIGTNTNTYELSIPTESVRKLLSVKLTPTSRPANGVSYTAGETVTINIQVKNSGNITFYDLTTSANLKNASTTYPTATLTPEANNADFNYNYTIMPEDIGQVLNFTVTSTSADGTTANASYTIPVASS